MKNLLLSLTYFFLSVVLSKGQSIDGIGSFDVVYDGHGNQYPISSLSVGSGKTIGGAAQIQAVIVSSCSAGYFTLHFVQNSYFDGNTNAQNVMCQLFSDLSGFISSTYTGQIHIACGSGTILGTAEPFYLFPPFATSSTQGILHNQIQKSLITGVDAYSNVPINTMYSNGGSGFYSAFLTAQNTPTLWSTSMNTTTLASNQYDLYSIMLHEATHALGFISLIGSNGSSSFGTSNLFYSVYDQFLYNASGTKLLAPLIPSCSVSSYSFQGTASDLAPGTCPGAPDLSTCSLAAQYIGAVAHTTVYTPDCFEGTSSLSHFEDICSYAPGFTTTCTPSPTFGFNNLYYTMSNGRYPGNCGLRRYLQEEERYVLCDLGYSVTGTYSLAGTAIKSYTGGQCSGTDVWGVNDGYVNGAFTYTTTGTSISIPTAAIVSNDAAGVDISCLEVLYNNGSYSISGGSLTISSNVNQGLVILKYYPKKGGLFGNVTYIFAFFYPGQCNVCDFVGNGGFENLGGGASCGPYVGTTQAYLAGYSILDCWQNYDGTPDLFTRNCSGGVGNPGQFDLGNNTYQMNPVTNSFNGVGNDRVINLIYNSTGVELIKNKLSNPLVPGNTYQLSMLVRNYSGPAHGTTTVNLNASPVVIAVASMQTFSTLGVSFPTGLNLLKDFTVPVTPGSGWTAITSTFGISSTITANHEAIVLGPDPIKTASLMGSNGAYIQFDNISILPYPVTTTFSIPNALSCGNSSFTNLAQYASTATVNSYTFTGAGVTFTNNQYHFNSTGTLQAGIYPIAFTFSTSNCLNTIYENVLISPPFNLTAFTNSASIPCAQFGNTITLAVSSSSLNPILGYTWQPGNLNGYLVTVSPSVSTIYSVTATNTFNCSETATLSIAVSTNCCNNPAIQVLTPTTITGTPVYLGPMRFLNSFTITGSMFLNGEFLISPGVSITVANGGQLNLVGAHLYGCLDMWDGIHVLDGGKVIMQVYNGVGNMIEDAETAVHVSNNTSSGTVLDISSTVFNKNYIDIDLSSCPSSSFVIHSNVFTSRNFTFNSTTWPQASLADLRSTIGGTNVLHGPYELQSQPLATLKSPRLGEYSRTAIWMNSVGTTSGTYPSFTFISAQIGLTPATSPENYFNLFDCHRNFIEAHNSNLRLVNNVFQNTIAFANTVLKLAIINFSATTSDKSLDMLATQPNVGNRFYDFHKGIHIINACDFKVENAVFRSSEGVGTSTMATNWIWGKDAISAQSSAFKNYIISNNEFNNIHYSIVLGTAGGTVNSIAIQSNTFSPTLGISSTATLVNLLNRAIALSTPFQVYSPAGSNGINISNNVIYRAANGIWLNGFSLQGSSGTCGEQLIIENNSVLLEEVSYAPIQQGIAITNNLPVYTGTGCPWPSAGAAGFRPITGNTVSLFNGNLNTTKVSLFQTFNSAGLSVPPLFMTCNKANDAYEGFAFEGMQPGIYWRGNKMDNLARGMILKNGGVIGQQGSQTGTASDNEWLGSAFTSTNYGIYTSASQATNSPIIKRTTPSQYDPPNLDGTPTNDSYIFGGITVYTGTNVFSCNGTYTQMPTIAIPKEDEYDSENLLYMARTSVYRALHFNSDLRATETEYSDFHSLFDGSIMETLADIEIAIGETNFTVAESLLAGLESDDLNYIEQNYFKFYELFFLYNQAGELSASEEVELSTLCALCPGTDGACIYQARALYQLVKEVPFDAETCSEGVGARNDFSSDEKSTFSTNTKLKATIHPNPASESITILLNKKANGLIVCIRDVSGRQIMKRVFDVESSIFKLTFELEQGVYFVTITDGNENVTKKVIVAK